VIDLKGYLFVNCTEEDSNLESKRLLGIYQYSIIIKYNNLFSYTSTHRKPQKLIE